MDRKNDVSGSMATYRIVLSVDGQTRLEYLMDGFTFGENHFAKVLSDYVLNGTTSNDIFRLAVLNEGGDAFLPSGRGARPDRPRIGHRRGPYRSGGRQRQYGRTDFPVTYDPSAAAATVSIPTDAEAVDFRRHYSRTTDGLKVTIPAGALYESLFYEQEQLSGRPAVTVGKKGRISCRISMPSMMRRYPLQAPVTLSFRADVPEELRERVVIARLTDKGRLAAAPAKYADGAVTGRASLFRDMVCRGRYGKPDRHAIVQVGEPICPASGASVSV